MDADFIALDDHEPWDDADEEQGLQDAHNQAGRNAAAAAIDDRRIATLAAPSSALTEAAGNSGEAASEAGNEVQAVAAWTGAAHAAVPAFVAPLLAAHHSAPAAASPKGTEAPPADTMDIGTAHNALACGAAEAAPGDTGASALAAASPVPSLAPAKQYAGLKTGGATKGPEPTSNTAVASEKEGKPSRHKPSKHPPASPKPSASKSREPQPTPFAVGAASSYPKAGAQAAPAAALAGAQACYPHASGAAAAAAGAFALPVFEDRTPPKQPAANGAVGSGGRGKPAMAGKQQEPGAKEGRGPVGRSPAGGAGKRIGAGDVKSPQGKAATPSSHKRRRSPSRERGRGRERERDRGGREPRRSPPARSPYAAGRREYGSRERACDGRSPGAARHDGRGRGERSPADRGAARGEQQRAEPRGGRDRWRERDGQRRVETTPLPRAPRRDGPNPDRVRRAKEAEQRDRPAARERLQQGPQRPYARREPRLPPTYSPELDARPGQLPAGAGTPLAGSNGWHKDGLVPSQAAGGYAGTAHARAGGPVGTPELPQPLPPQPPAQAAGPSYGGGFPGGGHASAPVQAQQQLAAGHPQQAGGYTAAAVQAAPWQQLQVQMLQGYGWLPGFATGPLAQAHQLSMAAQLAAMASPLPAGGSLEAAQHACGQSVRSLAGGHQRPGHWASQAAAAGAAWQAPHVAVQPGQPGLGHGGGGTPPGKLVGPQALGGAWAPPYGSGAAPLHGLAAPSPMQRTVHAWQQQAQPAAQPPAGLGLPASAPATHAVPAAPAAPEEQQVWFYHDPKGVMQGPHSVSQFRKWIDSLSRHPNLQEDYQAFRNVSVFRELGGAQLPLAILLLPS